MRHEWRFKEGNWLVSKVDCNRFSMGHFSIVFLFQWMAGSVQFSSAAQSCPTLCDPTNCSTPGLTVHHQLPESIQTHVHWVGDAIQLSHPVVPFSSCSQSFPTSGSFQMSQLFASGGQSIEVSASTSVLPVNTQDRSLGWTGWLDELIEDSCSSLVLAVFAPWLLCYVWSCTALTFFCNWQWPLCLSGPLPASSLPPRGVLLLPLREHDGFPVPMPAVPQLPALPELLLARPRQWPSQQPTPDEGAFLLGNRSVSQSCVPSAYLFHQ